MEIQTQVSYQDIRLHWKPIYTPGIAGFHVYRRLPNQKNFTRISKKLVSLNDNVYEDTLPLLQHLFTKAKVIEYRLRSFVHKNLYSNFSYTVHVNLREAIPYTINTIYLRKK